MSPVQPTFGKRKAPRFEPVAVAGPPTDHAAFFAEVRREMAEGQDARPRVVPRSLRAAVLSGLCVGLGLVGLDVTRAAEPLQVVPGLTLDAGTSTRLLPVIILLGLVGGTRAAAACLLVAHWGLRSFEITHHLAYAVAGGAVAGVLSALEIAALHNGLVGAAHLPTHGLPVDVVAGAAAGFLYRVFAGSQSQVASSPL